jgi:hypothetical protein
VRNCPSSPCRCRGADTAAIDMELGYQTRHSSATEESREDDYAGLSGMSFARLSGGGGARIICDMVADSPQSWVSFGRGMRRRDADGWEPKRTGRTNGTDGANTTMPRGSRSKRFGDSRETEQIKSGPLCGLLATFYVASPSRICRGVTTA